MTTQHLIEEIKDIKSNFNSSLNSDFSFLKEDLDIKNLNNPNKYFGTINEIEKLLRETRILFLHSVLNLACKNENEIYVFDSPFQAAMKYDAVIKKNNSFYLRDEDGDFREIFTSKEFYEFIDEQFYELYEGK